MSAHKSRRVSGKQIPRELVDALVIAAAEEAIKRIEAGEGNEEDVELVINSGEYLEDRKQGRIK